MKIFFLFLINVLFILSKKIKTKYQRVIISIREINMTNSTNKGSVWYLPNIANPSKKIGYYNSTCSQNAPIVERGFLVSTNKTIEPYPYVSNTYQSKMLVYPQSLQERNV